jgi:hypothetical protein
LLKHLLHGQEEPAGRLIAFAGVLAMVAAASEGVICPGANNSAVNDHDGEGHRAMSVKVVAQLNAWHNSVAVWFILFT